MLVERIFPCRTFLVDKFKNLVGSVVLVIVKEGGFGVDEKPIESSDARIWFVFGKGQKVVVLFIDHGHVKVLIGVFDGAGEEINGHFKRIVDA